MNNKGFTLIELVATIGLLAVISIISYVSINKVLIESKISDCEQLVMSIKSAAKDYISDNRYNLTSNSNVEINALYLINNKYLTGPIVDPFNKTEITDDGLKNIKIIVELNPDYAVKKINIEAPSFLIDGKCE